MAGVPMLGMMGMQVPMIGVPMGVPIMMGMPMPMMATPMGQIMPFGMNTLMPATAAMGVSAAAPGAAATIMSSQGHVLQYGLPAVAPPQPVVVPPPVPPPQPGILRPPCITKSEELLRALEEAAELAAEQRLERPAPAAAVAEAPAPASGPRQGPEGGGAGGRGAAGAAAEGGGTGSLAASQPARSADTAAPNEAEEREEDSEPFRCHLHPLKRPSAKCKFCQRAQGIQQQEANKALSSTASPIMRDVSSAEVPEDYSRRTFNCSPMLKDQILGSSYFKSLLAINSLEDLIEEIEKYADTLDVYNPGSTVSPSCFICQVYRLFTLPSAEDLGEVHALLDHRASPAVRCAGFLYIRFVVAPARLWEKLEEYLFDDMELQYTEGGKAVTSTIGEYVETLLVRDKYFSTPLPRIPVKVWQLLEKELAPLPQYRKRMQANQRAFRAKQATHLPVEAFVDGAWLSGTTRDFAGRASRRRRVRVRLERGDDVVVHLGKVVLRGEATGSRSDDSGSEAGRSRSRSRDWSRWKGSSSADMLEALREKAKEEAVCGQGKAYARRPLTVEEELWKREPEVRVSMLGEDRQRVGHGRGVSAAAATADARGDGPRDAAGAARSRALREQEDLERQKRIRDIYEKYGSAPGKSGAAGAAGAAAAGGPLRGPRDGDMDLPEVLRLG